MKSLRCRHYRTKQAQKKETKFAQNDKFNHKKCKTEINLTYQNLQGKPHRVHAPRSFFICKL